MVVVAHGVSVLAVVDEYSCMAPVCVPLGSNTFSSSDRGWLVTGSCGRTVIPWWASDRKLWEDSISYSGLVTGSYGRTVYSLVGWLVTGSYRRTVYPMVS